MDTWSGCGRMRIMMQPGGRDKLQHSGGERVYIPLKNELGKQNNACIANEINEKTASEKLNKHTL